jgi:hypothetical protein
MNVSRGLSGAVTLESRGPFRPLARFRQPQRANCSRGAETGHTPDTETAAAHA